MDIETKNQIQAQLDQVNKYTRRLIDGGDQIPRIELDALMEKIRELYYYIWKLGEAPDSEQPVGEEKTIKPEEPPQPQSAPIQTETEGREKEKTKEQPKDSEEFELLKKNIESLRQQFEEIEKDKKHHSPSAPKDETFKKQSPEPSNKTEKDMKGTSGPKTQENQGESAHSTKPEKHHDNSEKKHLKKNLAEQNGNHSKSLGETFSASKSSVNDYLSLHKSESTIGDRMKQNKVNDLKAAIDLNHKFLFITELFDGNSPEYSQTIERLNNAASLEEAFKILTEKREKYRWDEKEGTFRIFNDLIHRKFQ